MGVTKMVDVFDNREANDTSILPYTNNGNIDLNFFSDNSISFLERKIAIDKSSEGEVLDLLNSKIPQDILNYIIDTKIDEDNILKFLASGTKSLHEIIIKRKVNMNNIFEVTRYGGLVAENVYKYMHSEIKDFFNSLTADNILDVMENKSVNKDFIYTIYTTKLDILKEAVRKSPIAKLKKVIATDRDNTVLTIIKYERNEVLSLIIESLHGRELLDWLSFSTLDINTKSKIITLHSEEIFAEIKKHRSFIIADLLLCKESSLPDIYIQKIFNEYLDEYITRFNRLTDEETIDKIIFGNNHSLVKRLLINLKISSNNIGKLLSSVSRFDDDVLSILIENKKLEINHYLNSLSLNNLLYLDNLSLATSNKEGLLASCSDIILSKLKDVNKERKIEYLKDPKVLPAAKKSIISSMGINVEIFNILYSSHYQNQEEMEDLFLNNYNDIEKLFSILNVNFQKFLQYGGGSKRYSNWLNNIVSVIKNQDTLSFIKVKDYLFNNFYDNTSNDVKIISNLLEVINSFSLYKDLLLDLANNNVPLSSSNKSDLDLLFSSSITFPDLTMPKKLADVNAYKQSISKKLFLEVKKATNIGEIKELIYKYALLDTNNTLNYIGGSEEIIDLIDENKNSPSICKLANEILAYAKVIERIQYTSDINYLYSMIDSLFSDIDTLTSVRWIFSHFNDKVKKLFEADSSSHLTSLNKARKISGVIDSRLSEKYGGEVFDFSNKNYVLLAHVLSKNETIDDLVDGRSSGLKNFISLSPISYRGEKYYYNRSTCILAYDTIPRGSFICSSNNNMSTNNKLKYSDSEVLEGKRRQRSILKSSMAYDSNAEFLLYRDGLKPVGLILPGGRVPTLEEMQIHKKYKLPFIITQDCLTCIDNPKMLFNNNDTSIDNTDYSDTIDRIFNITESNLAIDDSSLYTGREIAIFTDCHAIYEATKAIIDDINSHNIKEIYSLGDSVGSGPNPAEVFDLLEDNGIIQLAGNSEYYNTLGLEPFPYIYGERVDNCKFTYEELGSDRVSKLKIFKASIDLVIGGKKIALCHFANDVRWDYLGDRSVYAYQSKLEKSDAAKQFLYTNSEEFNDALETVISKADISDKGANGYRASKEEPLFDGEVITSYDAVIQGHMHYEASDKISHTDIYTLRAAGTGYGKDPINSACYYVLKERKASGFDIEKRLVPFNRKSVVDSVYKKDIPDKAKVLKYLEL